MANSVNTNNAAQIALANLTRVNEQLQGVQSRVSTGLKINSAQDDGAGFAVAQKLRSEKAGLGAVNERLSFARGITGLANTTIKEVQSSMQGIREVAVKLADESLDEKAREQYQADFKARVADVSALIRDANYNGKNLLNTANSIAVVANLNGDDIQINHQSSAVGSAYGFLAAMTAATLTRGDFKNFISAGGNLKLAEDKFGGAANAIAADDRRIRNAISFNSAVSDAITKGIGQIVDADLGAESARLQALQVQAQLAGQALSIANQGPQALLSLFR